MRKARFRVAKLLGRCSFSQCKLLVSDELEVYISDTRASVFLRIVRAAVVAFIHAANPALDRLDLCRSESQN